MKGLKSYKSHNTLGNMVFVGKAGQLQFVHNNYMASTISFEAALETHYMKTGQHKYSKLNDGYQYEQRIKQG